MQPEIERRSAQALTAYVPAAASVFGNVAIDQSVRLQLAASLVFSILLYGADAWSQLSKSAMHRLRTVHMRVSRKVAGVFRTGSGSVTDEQVLELLGQPNMVQQVRRARLLYVARLSRTCPPLLAAVLQDSPAGVDEWVQLVASDIEHLRSRTGQKLAELPAFLHHPQPWMELWSKHGRQWGELVNRAYGKYAPAEPGDECAVAMCGCEHCEAVFSCKQGLATHCTRAHGHRNDLRAFVEFRQCPACGKEFPTRARAVHHLTYSAARCRARVLHGGFERVPEARLAELDASEARSRRAAQRAGFHSCR